jgi:hypothetical protein
MTQVRRRRLEAARRTAVMAVLGTVVGPYLALAETY